MVLAVAERDGHRLQPAHGVPRRELGLTLKRFSILERPDLLAQQKATAGSVVFEYPKRPRQITTTTTEQDFTTSLLRLSTGRSPKAYFLTGHGEGDIANVAQSGASFTALKALLDKQGITSATLNLASGAAPGAAPAPSPSAASSPAAGASPAASPTPLQTTSVPADASEVVILDPRAALSDAEVASLNAYVAGGGHLLVSSPPLAKNNLNSLVSKYGLSFGAGIVVDPQMHYRNANDAVPVVLLVQQFGQSLVTTGLDTLPVVLLGSTSIDGTAPAGYTFTPLITTQGDACLRTDVTITAATCQSGEKAGPFSLAGALEQTNAKAGSRPIRIATFGGASFADDLIASQQQPPPGNMQLMINAVNWLAGQDKVINIAPHTATPAAVFLTDAQKQLILIGYPFLLPLLVAGLGVYVYVRRRQ